MLKTSPSDKGKVRIDPTRLDLPVRAGQSSLLPRECNLDISCLPASCYIGRIGQLYLCKSSVSGCYPFPTLRSPPRFWARPRILRPKTVGLVGSEGTNPRCKIDEPISNAPVETNDMPISLCHNLPVACVTPPQLALPPCCKLQSNFLKSQFLCRNTTWLTVPVMPLDAQFEETTLVNSKCG